MLSVFLCYSVKVNNAFDVKMMEISNVQKSWLVASELVFRFRQKAEIPLFFLKFKQTVPKCVFKKATEVKLGHSRDIGSRKNSLIYTWMQLFQLFK